MIRVICAPFLLLAIICALVCRCIARSGWTLAIAMALILIILLSGCAAVPLILERDAQACHNAAWTVADMLRCQELYPAHETSPSDWASQPISELERIIQHRAHDHD